MRVYLGHEGLHAEHLTDELESGLGGLGFVERQHDAPHLATVADGNVRHELNPTRNHRVTVATGQHANTWTQEAGSMWFDHNKWLGVDLHGSQ